MLNKKSALLNGLILNYGIDTHFELGEQVSGWDAGTEVEPGTR